MQTTIGIEALRLLNAMREIDLYDYLSDYASEPDEGQRDMRSMRLAVLLDIGKTGPGVFIARMSQGETLQ